MLERFPTLDEECMCWTFMKKLSQEVKRDPLQSQKNKMGGIRIRLDCLKQSKFIFKDFYLISAPLQNNHNALKVNQKQLVIKVAKNHRH